MNEFVSKQVQAKEEAVEVLDENLIDDISLSEITLSSEENTEDELEVEFLS